MATTDLTQYSRQDFTNAIAQSIRDHDFDMTIKLVKLMASVYPQEAEDVFETLVLGVEIAKRDR